MFEGRGLQAWMRAWPLGGRHDRGLDAGAGPVFRRLQVPRSGQKKDGDKVNELLTSPAPPSSIPAIVTSGEIGAAYRHRRRDIYLDDLPDPKGANVNLRDSAG